MSGREVTVISGGTDKTPNVGSGEIVLPWSSNGGDGVGVISGDDDGGMLGAGLTVMSCMLAIIACGVVILECKDRRGFLDFTCFFPFFLFVPFFPFIVGSRSHGADLGPPLTILWGSEGIATDKGGFGSDQKHTRAASALSNVS